jgi:hypothetical protein
MGGVAALRPAAGADGLPAKGFRILNNRLIRAKLTPE